MEIISRFAAGRLSHRPAVDDELLVADSWLVADGSVRFLDDHERRFRAACHDAGADDECLSGFWRAATDALPRSGRWFPRVELSAGGELRLRLRPAPPPGKPLRVSCGPCGDPRRKPHVKGPDLPLQLRLRAEAARHGADELLFRSAEGWLVEGTTTSLLWWEAETLCVPAQELACLPGVTSIRLQRRAAALGITVARRWREPLALAGREVWLVNSVHGIRPVAGWSDPDVQAGPAVRAAPWQRWLLAQGRPLSPESPHNDRRPGLP